MKKFWYIVLVISVFINCLSFLTVSADTYDTNWTMTIKNEDSQTEGFKAGDKLIVEIINSNKVTSLTDTVIKFTYNSNLLEYATTVPVCGLSSSDISKDVSYEELNTDGLFRGAFATATKAEILAGQTMYKVYFKVKDEIPDGITALNFRWIHTGNDKSYVASGEKNYSIDFIDASTTVKGNELAKNPDKLSGISDSMFVPSENPTASNPETVNLNGNIVTLTSPYVVVFSKLLPANSKYIEAGIMISETQNENMDKDTSGVYYAKAEKFTSDNRFGVLFYGKGLKAGTNYYAKVRVEYEDFVIYSDTFMVTTAK